MERDFHNLTPGVRVDLRTKPVVWLMNRENVEKYYGSVAEVDNAFFWPNPINPIMQSNKL